jgi:hypothetical protein
MSCNVDIHAPDDFTIQTTRQGASITLAVHIVVTHSSPVQKVEYYTRWRRPGGIIYPLDGLG